MLGPSVDHEPLDRVGGALVLQLPHVGRQPRAVPVPLVPEVTEVSGGVSGGVFSNLDDVNIRGLFGVGYP